jgi:thioredoxin 1
VASQFHRWSIALIFLLVGPGVSAASPQTAARKPPVAIVAPAFEPLELWKKAVFSGDPQALSRLYTTNPPARAKTPRGETQDPAEEPSFWSTLGKAGLSQLDIKILEIKNPQPQVKTLVLRMGVRLQQQSQERSGIISVSQVWLQQGSEWRIAMTQRGDLVAAAPMRLPEPAKPNTQLYPPPEEAQGEIAAALRASQTDHKRVLLVFGGNWCYDCHVLDATFRSKSIAPLVAQNYHVVHVNVGDYDRNIDLAKKYEIPLEKGVPSLAILDPDGSLVVSQKKGEFESTAKLGTEDVVGFLRQWKPKAGS